MNRLALVLAVLLLSACMENTPAETPQAAAPKADASCARAGCSSQLCVDAKTAGDIASTCEWREEYQCYNDHGVCTRLDDGECGWADTAELAQCLASPAYEPTVYIAPTN